jgi:hypothetical protein
VRRDQHDRRATLHDVQRHGHVGSVASRAS